jgi:glycosyltransferase involved in cell wall biosynthesis
MTTDCVGGVWSYAMTLCGGLAAAGVEVTLAATGGLLRPDQAAQAAALPNVDLRHRPLRCEWMQPPLADVPAAAAWLESLAAEVRPDVIHLNDYAHGGQCFGGRPRVVVAHSDVVTWHRAVVNREPGVLWQDYVMAVSAGLSAANVVVAPTRAVLTAMTDVGLLNATARQEVIYNAVAEGPAPAAQREPFILTAGRVWDEAKNVRTLAAAAAGLPWPVKVAGDATAPDGGRVVFENVELLGPVPHQELRHLMSVAGIYALPARYEPFGLSAVEAALGGCPLVLGDIPTLREVWGDAVTFVRPDDVEGLRAALEKLITTEATNPRTRDRATTFSIERQVRQYVALYQSL